MTVPIRGLDKETGNHNMTSEQDGTAGRRALSQPERCPGRWPSESDTELSYSSPHWIDPDQGHGTSHEVMLRLYPT